MHKRKLKRQLGLGQVVMLGAVGTIGAQIFVLTGHAAGLAGPATVLALLVGGLLSYSIALNYCELATTYPVAGGAMSYVREAFGAGMLSYLVGSMDCISSTFYAALSAVGFAYSLNIFVPGLPIVPTAAAAIVIFVGFNLLGVTNVGNVQVVLGIVLLCCFLVFIGAGLFAPRGFAFDTFVSGNVVFAGQDIWFAGSRILVTTALVYSAYVGFEVIADDAEEISAPTRNIPLGILISLTLTLIVYMLVSLVTLGTVPWQQLVGSEIALTDAVQRFLPGWGVPMMALAGMIATLTSINSAMLSATREAFTLGRDGVWPTIFAKLSRFRTPWVAIVLIGLISVLVAAIGLVDFLSYISSSGYLFVLFWSSVSMLRLRKRLPDLERPFKAPWFPFTAYVAGGTCILIVAFADPRALAFSLGVLALFALLRYAAPFIIQYAPRHFRYGEPEPGKDRIIVAVANPRTSRGLIYVASIIAKATVDPYICVLTVNVMARQLVQRAARIFGRDLDQRQTLLQQAVADARQRNIAVYTKIRTATSVDQGIVDELAQWRNVNLLLTGWPGPLKPAQLMANPVHTLLQKAHTNVAVLLDRGLLHQPLRRILVPVGGGPHSRMALNLAYELALAEGADVVALRVLTNVSSDEPEEIEDQTSWLAEVITEVLGTLPGNFDLQAHCARSLRVGVLQEMERLPFDLIVMGASEEWGSATWLFGSVDDWIANQVSCSVLLCRYFEPVALAWLRRRMKAIEHEYERARE